MDLAYKPYAEIVNLMVNPEHRGRGIGTLLLRKCIEIAEERGFTIQYLVTSIDNRIALKLCSKFGFTPTILPRKIMKKRNIWLHRFSCRNFVREFIENYYFLEYSISKDKILLEGKWFHRVIWKDAIVRDKLTLYFKVNLDNLPTEHSRSFYEKGNTAIELHMSEETNTIGYNEYSTFTLKVANTVNQNLTIEEIVPIEVSGVGVKSEVYDRLMLKPKELRELNLKCRLLENFDIPDL